MEALLRIAVWYNLPSGGATRALYEHLVGLKALGHEIEAWRPPSEDRGFMDIGAFVPEHEVPMAPFRFESNFYPRHMFLASREAERLAQVMEQHSRACAAEINAGRFDVLFANTDVWFHAPFVGRYVNIPRVLYIQEPNRPLYEAQPRMPWLPPDIPEGVSVLKRLRAHGRSYIEGRNAQALAGAEWENARHYERILVNSRFSRESILRAYGVDAAVCYLGIDASHFSNLALPRERFVISVGSLTPSKSPEFIVRALGTIPKAERPPLVWIYNYSLSDLFLREITALAASLDVQFDARRLVPDSELIDLLNLAGAFVYAPRLEPFGLAPLEANACGAPVVAVAEGGVRETIEDGVNGLLADADPAVFGERVRTLLADPALARRLGEAGEARVRSRWSVDEAARRLELHLREVAEK